MKFTWRPPHWSGVFLRKNESKAYSALLSSTELHLKIDNTIVMLMKISD